MVQHSTHGVDVRAGHVIILDLGLDSYRIGLQVGNGHNSPIIQGAATYTCSNHVGSFVLTWKGAGPALVSIAADGGQGCLSHLPPALMGVHTSLLSLLS